MSRLIKPTVYAKEQNISRQAVYAKIKKGLLASKRVDGKIYIIIDEDEKQSETNPLPPEENSPVVDIKELLASKDETISILKESIKDLKETNTEINTTLRGEIELLKQVFAEMRNLYVKQVDYIGERSLSKVEHKSNIESTEVREEEEGECWVDLETFFERASIKKRKKKEKIKNRLLKAYQAEDSRIRIKEGILFMSCYDFYEDILQNKKS